MASRCGMCVLWSVLWTCLDVPLWSCPLAWCCQRCNNCGVTTGYIEAHLPKRLHSTCRDSSYAKLNKQTWETSWDVACGLMQCVKVFALLLTIASQAPFVPNEGCPRPVLSRRCRLDTKARDDDDRRSEERDSSVQTVHGLGDGSAGPVTRPGPGGLETVLFGYVRLVQSGLSPPWQPRVSNDCGFANPDRRRFPSVNFSPPCI
jgi:hypothetical protein